MTGRARRRGVFEGMPRALYRRTGARYLDACAAEIVGNGVVVAIFSVAVVALYVDLGAGELGALAACLLVGYVAESLLAGHHLRRVGAPIRNGAAQPAWEAAARLPGALARRPRLCAGRGARARPPSLYAGGAAGGAAASVVLAALLGLPAYRAALAFPVLSLLYVSSAVLRYIALALGLRPV